MTHDHPPQPILMVDSGLHRFARCTIVSGESLVGAGLDNTIVVTDHTTRVGFKLKRSDAGVVLQAVDADLDIRGKTLSAGQARKCSKSLAFRSGGVMFRLELPTPPGPVKVPLSFGSLSHASAFAGGAGCAVVLTLAASLHAAPVPKFPDISLETTGSIRTDPTPGHDGSGRTNASAASVLDGLRRQIVARGLDMVTLSGQPDGAIEAIGKITPAQDAAWHDVGRWFDTASGGRTVLVDHVQTSVDAPPLQIQAVWPGRNPYVVDGSGDKLFVGTVLPSGWAIHGIEAKRVLIKRGDQTVAVRF